MHFIEHFFVCLFVVVFVHLLFSSVVFVFSCFSLPEVYLLCKTVCVLEFGCLFLFLFSFASLLHIVPLRKVNQYLHAKHLC